tara:strand:- start:450 stop:719 length:270 start_codon:yes stop_codon:yes gene_type:complete
MKPHDNTDPWSQGQKQVHYSAPGWLSKLTLIVTVPFRLVFGVISLVLGAGRAFSDTKEEDSYQAYKPNTSDWYNLDGTQNMDGDKNTGN